MRSRSRFLASAISAGALAAVRAPARPAQFEFKMGTDLVAAHPIVQRLGQMWATVERDSGGRVHVDLFPGGSLGKDLGMLAQLRVGALQFQLLAPGILSSVVPATDIGALGFAFRNSDEALRVMSGPLGTYLHQEILARGIYSLRSLWDNGMFEVGSIAQPVRRPADFQGLKLRVSDSKITIDLFKELGATPTPMSPNEMYSALQTKLIDGESAPLAVIEASRLYEVNKYIAMTNHAWSGVYLLSNVDAWRSLPADLQNLIERNNTRFASLARSDMKAAESALIAQMERRGLTVSQIDPEPFRLKLHPYYDAWAGAFGQTAWRLLETSLGHKLT